MKKLDTSWKIFSVYLLMIFLMLLTNLVSAQVVVTQFNADWNSTNDVEWFQKLNDCDLTKVDIVKQTKLQEKHKIVIVPTIIIFKDGEEIKRYQADLSFKMLATRKEIQNFINEQIMSDF
ncbi:thioredoxin family protein [bacterium]|nr:thioredoxin family protein [bacterium]